MKKILFAAFFVISAKAYAFNPIRYVQISTGNISQQSGGFNTSTGTVQTFVSTTATINNLTSSTFTLNNFLGGSYANLSTATYSGQNHFKNGVDVSTSIGTSQIFGVWPSSITTGIPGYFTGTTSNDNAPVGC